MDPDSAIRSTDSDAAQARLSAVNKGYLEDPFIAYFVPRARFLSPRPPLINVGTFVRATAIDTLVHQWIDINPESQIVSLGAGSDTRFWRLSAQSRISRVRHYVEVDFPENTARKTAIIRKTPSLSQYLLGVVRTEQGGMALRATNYTLIPADLRLPPAATLGPLLTGDTLSPNIPTLFISECVFAYMPKASSDALINWFSENFEITAGALYEMFGLNDPFGKIMRQNLMSRNVSLPGVDAYPALDSQRERYLNASFSHANALSLKRVRWSHIPPAEASRIAALEMLDEVEELDLVLEHYVVAWGVKVPDKEAGPGDLIGWGLKENPSVPVNEGWEG
ncbi:leucine carboxyl methyltransferase [Clavulina sp. PMI_390]|nr:leucine carboxyl methyltransferase [Clavulina sp. PMI_390]